MTVLATRSMAAACNAALRQLFLVILTNVPTAMFGACLAWVSGAAARGAEGGAAVAGGAGATHAAAVAGVIMAAAGLQRGRKPPIIAASAAFAACWGLKLVGGAGCLLAARLLAGLAGAAAWCAAPLLAAELCGAAVRGAAAAAPVLAHNVGFLLMFAAADSGLQPSTILWCCLGVSVAHCALFLFAPESPAYLAAAGRTKAARRTLAWVLAAQSEGAEVEAEMKALPPPEEAGGASFFTLIKELWSSPRRRRALLIGVAAVAGQESFGLLALLQFAEPVLAAGAGAKDAASLAVMLGAVQLAASALALYLVERLGRKPLISWTALVCAGALVAASVVVFVTPRGDGGGGGGGGGRWLAGALSLAVAADSLGMQPAPYALLADMFDYRYRGAALLVSMAAAAAGNALEVLIFGAVAAAAGIKAAIPLAAVLTAAYTLFSFLGLPDTKNKTVDEIYDELGPALPQFVTEGVTANNSNNEPNKTIQTHNGAKTQSLDSKEETTNAKNNIQIHDGFKPITLHTVEEGSPTVDAKIESNGLESLPLDKIAKEVLPYVSSNDSIKRNDMIKTMEKNDVQKSELPNDAMTEKAFIPKHTNTGVDFLDPSVPHNTTDTIKGAVASIGLTGGQVPSASVQNISVSDTKTDNKHSMWTKL